MDDDRYAMGRACLARLESRPRCASSVTFILFAFEGPDAYARAGGLAVRVSELAQALAEGGDTVHLIFVGDPELRGEEALLDGRLVLHRWCQWISRYHPEGVYAGEDGKWRDYTHSVPPFVVDQIVRPALASGDSVVILGEEWHTGRNDVSHQRPAVAGRPAPAGCAALWERQQEDGL